MSIEKTVAKDLAAYDSKLSEIVKQKYDAENAVKAAADAIVFEGVQEYLKTVDVEELNRDKQGIRIQLLRDARINTIADVLKYDKRRLVAINGIGEQGAAAILKAAKQIEKAAKKNIPVKLSVDDKSREKDELILQLYRYKRNITQFEKAEKLFKSTHKTIDENVPLLKTGFSRLFASKESKLKSEAAMAELLTIYNGTYPDDVKDCIASGVTAKKTESPTLLKKAASSDFIADPAAYYSLLDAICGIKVTTGDETELDEEMQAEIEAVDVDESLLKCTLRKYQYFGVQFILNRGQVLLGDEMGLGKTIEAIAAMASLAADGETHFVVVCPAAVLTNWCREITDRSEMTAYKLHSDEREENTEKWLTNGGVAVTTFEMSGKIELPDDLKIAMLIVDEAHYIKNPEAQRTKSVLSIRKKSARVLFMTGTPMENRLDEMCFLISCLQPAIAKEITGMKSVSGTEGFRKKIAPVYIRRTREAVLKELPDLIESEEWCTMSREEKSLYRESVEEQNFMAMRQVSWNLPDVSGSSKAQRLENILENAAEQGRKVIVFSFFLNTIAKVSQMGIGAVYGPINGSMSPEQRQQTVDEFSAHEGFAVLLSQIQAGGTGLNIQAASVIVICEPQIKPSIENQAIARAYRMGQLNSVLVYRLLCEDSVDARVLSIMKQKQELFDKYADKSVSGDETLKEAEQAEIIEQEKKRLLESA